MSRRYRSSSSSSRKFNVTKTVEIVIKLKDFDRNSYRYSKISLIEIIKNNRSRFEDTREENEDLKKKLEDANAKLTSTEDKAKELDENLSKMDRVERQKSAEKLRMLNSVEETLEMFSEKHINESMLRRFFLGWKEEVVHSKLVNNSMKVNGMLQDLNRTQSEVDSVKQELDATKKDRDEKLAELQKMTRRNSEDSTAREELATSKKELETKLAALQQKLDNEQKLRALMAEERDKLIEELGDESSLAKRQREIDELMAENKKLRNPGQRMSAERDALQDRVDHIPNAQGMKRQAGLLLVRISTLIL